MTKEYEILLLNIFRDNNGYSESFNDSIGQYLLASYLREHDFIAQVYSGTVLNCLEIIKKEVEDNHIKIIGFYAASDNIRIVANTIKWIKQNFDVITIVGGPQAIDLKEDFFKSTGNDYVIIGEGEIPLLNLLYHLIDNTCQKNDIPSLVYWNNNKDSLLCNSSENGLIMNLDLIPFPKIEDSYFKKLRNDKMVGILTGRGCPNHCTFCYEGANAKNVRFRSIENVMEEIDYIVANNPSVEYINVYDDTFTLQPSRVLQFCEQMRKRNLKWFCEGHITFVLKHPEILQTMVNSGLTCIQFGIESGSSKVLNAYNKNTTKDMILKCIEICKECGINGITGNLIIGGAWEDRNTLKESRELAQKMIECAKGIIEIYCVYFAPYPNTQMVKYPNEFGIEIYYDLISYSLHTMRTPVVSTQSLSVSDIYNCKHEFEELLAKAYLDASMSSTKKDIFQGLFQNGKRIQINPTWEKYYNSLNHISVFIKHLSDDEQKFSATKYIIRTFEDFKIENDIMITEIGEFTGIEKDVLCNAVGIYTPEQISKKLNQSIEDIEKVYISLNNRCLVYMSLW